MSAYFLAKLKISLSESMSPVFDESEATTEDAEDTDGATDPCDTDGTLDDGI